MINRRRSCHRCRPPNIESNLFPNTNRTINSHFHNQSWLNKSKRHETKKETDTEQIHYSFENHSRVYGDEFQENTGAAIIACSSNNEKRVIGCNPNNNSNNTTFTSAPQQIKSQSKHYIKNKTKTKLNSGCLSDVKNRKTKTLKVCGELSKTNMKSENVSLFRNKNSVLSRDCSGTFPTKVLFGPTTVIRWCLLSDVGVEEVFTASKSRSKCIVKLNVSSLWMLLLLFLIMSLNCVAGFGGTPPQYSRDQMPNTTFTCDDKASGGYYADHEAECQMFHVCVRVSEDEVSE